jgi:hypothetical protein
MLKDKLIYELIIACLTDWFKSEFISMEKNPPREANSSSANQEIPHLL